MVVELKLEKLKEEYRRKDERGVPMSIREQYWKKMASLKEKLQEKDHEKKLGQVLLEKKFVDDNQLKEALNEQAESREDELIGEVMLKKDLITEKQLKHAIRDQVEQNGMKTPNPNKAGKLIT